MHFSTVREPPPTVAQSLLPAIKPRRVELKLLQRCRALVPSLVIVSLAMGLVVSSGSHASAAAPRAGVSPEEKATFLTDHNAWRAKYNSPALVWDDEIAAFADAWATDIANRGAFEHRPNNPYGEN